MVLDENGTFTGTYTGGYTGIHCLHCPGEDPRGPDGEPDYSFTCSGHGRCIAGEYCECEPAWDGFSDDCSHLACPADPSEDEDEERTFCTGVGECINAPLVQLNDTVTVCDENGESTLSPHEFVRPPNDWVARYVDCEARTMLIAQCSCPPMRSIPFCGEITVEEGSLTVLGSPAASRVRPSAGASFAIAMAVAVAFLCNR